jgi:hypothetical protein
VIDPVSLAVVALARALITSSIQGAGEAAGGDAYHAIKARILKKYPAASTSIDNLEREPHSQERQDNVAATLRRLGGSDDPELAQLADQLMAAIQYGYQPGQGEYQPPRQQQQPRPGPQGGQRGHQPGTGENAHATDRVAQTRRSVGVRMIDQILGEHVRRVSELRSRYLLDDSSLLSSNISQVRDVPMDVRNEVSSLHGRIRQIIGQVAWSIENGRYADAYGLVGTLPSRSEQERAARLVEADKAICVSYETLRLTVDYFSELNQQVLRRIEQESSGPAQNQMMFGNAIMIYELADFMIGFIRSFAPSGLFELEALHEETLERIREAKDRQRRIEERARQEPDSGVRNGILENVKQRDAALQLLQQEWDSYVAQTKELHNLSGEVQSKIPTLELIRDNARLQLDVLELVAMLRFLRQNAEAVHGAVRTLQGLRLAPLTPDKVLKLLGTRD